jgi:hypothetical protein
MTSLQDALDAVEVAVRVPLEKALAGLEDDGPMFKIRHAYFGKYVIDGPGGMTFWKVPAGPDTKSVPWSNKAEAQAALDILET